MGTLSPEANAVLLNLFQLWLVERKRKRTFKAGDVVLMRIKGASGDACYPVKLAERTAPGVWTVTRHVGTHPNTKRVAYENVELKKVCRVPHRKARPPHLSFSLGLTSPSKKSLDDSSTTPAHRCRRMSSSAASASARTRSC